MSEIRNHILQNAVTHRRRPSRKTVFDKFQELLSWVEVQSHVPYTVVESMSTLRAFFLPTVSAPKTPEQWVAIPARMARKNDDPRTEIGFCYFAEGVGLVGTDGHRLHIVPACKDHEPGTWFDPDTMEPVEVSGLKYPDVSKVIPDPTRRVELPPVEDWDVREFHNGTIAVQVPWTDCWLDVRYAKDAAPIALLNDPGPTDAVLFETKFGTAVVMPYRIQKEGK